MPEPVYTSAGATFGGVGDMYRYTLWREWDTAKPTVVFIMLNPSTADDTTLDPTLRRCLGYSMQWGYGRMEILNLFALRSTNPSKLKTCSDPVGPQNNLQISWACKRDRLIIAGWGAHGGLYSQDLKIVNIVTRGCGKDLYCLQMTGGGFPGHPLYLKRGLEPVIYRPAQQ
jgi:hypothetical protein